jgi:beta-xylosidase
MTALLPTRALTPDGGVRSKTIRRLVPRLAIATVAVIAGVAWPIQAAVGPDGSAPHGMPPTGAPLPGVGPAPKSEPRRDHPPTTVPSPPPLSPLPPSDGRDAPDPFILADGRGYVLYSTQVGLHNVPVATSPDLRHWSPPSDALPQLPAWAAWGRTWAPGVTPLAGRYLLYFAAQHQASGRQCIGVATSTAAQGPFTPSAGDPLVCQTHLGGSIDPHPFVDHDGTPYVLWKADGNAIGQRSTLFAQRLTPDGLVLAGQPVPLLNSDSAWEQPLIENPALVATGTSYLLFYSGGWWESAGYATGYATCTSPLGPCTKATIDQPLHASAGDQAGPGGACLIKGPAGDHWLAYHAWNPGAIGYTNGGSRSLHFAPLVWPNNQPIVGR